MPTSHPLLDVLDEAPPQQVPKSHLFGAPGRFKGQPRGTISSTSPFRVGGRGSKQLSKALEKSSQERGQAGDTHCEPQWAFCLGKNPCFAKILPVNNPLHSSKSVIVQPMFSNAQDPHLFTLWEGHLWMAKIDKLHPVKVK